jgi:hypothetical protein
MNEHKPTPPIDDDEISLVELIQKARAFFRRVLREKRIIVFCMLVTLPIGLLIAFGSTKQYSASLRIMPYRAASGSGGLGGLAGLAGIKIPSRGAEETVQPEMYPDIAQSLDFQIAIAETPLYFSSFSKRITPVTYFTEYAEPAFADQVMRYTIGLPKLLLSTVIGWFKSEEPVLEGGEDPTPYLLKYSKDYLSLISGVGNAVSVEPEMIKGFTNVTSLKIQASMPDPQAAAGLAKAAADQLMESVIKFEIRKIKDELDYLEDHHDNMEARYHKAQSALAAFRDRTRNTTSAATQSEMERLQNEFTMSYDLYRSVRAELEQARIKLNRDTPVFTILENVVVPNEPASPRKGRVLILSVFLGVFFGVGIIGARAFWEQIEANEPPADAPAKPDESA